MTQTLLTIFIPTLMVLVGILLNRGDSSRLDARISSVQSQLDGRMSGLEARMSALESKMDGRISALEARLHGDMMQVIGKLTELEVWVARLEEDH